MAGLEVLFTGDLPPQMRLLRFVALCTLVAVWVAWRVAVAPPSPPPRPPAKPWVAQYGDAVVLGVPGNVFGTISYVYADRASGACAVVDACGHASYLTREMAARNWRLDGLLQTHGHLDHVQALPDYARRTGLTPRMHAGDARMLRTFGIPTPDWRVMALPGVARATAATIAWILGMSRERQPETAPLADGELLTVGKLTLRVLWVPGHTPGSVCFYDAANRVMFSGDFLMKGTVGRVDLPESDPDAMQLSLRRIAAEIPDDVTLLSGHTDPTTMAAEKRNNPFLRQYA